MNSQSKITQELLDRLVDGELSDSERRNAIRLIESENAWRSCALSFLEAQAWEADLENWLEPAHSAPSQTKTPQGASDHGGRVELFCRNGYSHSCIANFNALSSFHLSCTKWRMW